ncbi:MAG TPA: hypothetical protein VHO50_10025 [Bacteroidales bacterium]|nr:hypothetical protein [Bacteroidales bacterium]
MRLTPEYLVSGFILLLGLFILMYKPFYDEDKRLNLRKASIYQGWIMIALGICMIILKVVLDVFDLPGWVWPLGILIGIIPLLIITFRLKKACYIKDESENLEFDSETQKRKATVVKRFALIFATGFTLFLFISMLIRPSIKIEDDRFKVGGGFGFEYPVSEIVKIDTVNGYPNVGLMLGGSAFKGVFKGRFELMGHGSGRLFLKKGLHPYIFLRFSDNEVVYFNLETREETIEFYDELLRKVKTKGAI